MNNNQKIARTKDLIQFLVLIINSNEKWFLFDKAKMQIP